MPDSVNALLPNIDGYQLVRKIGAGGMSTVYEAINLNGVRVALKLLHPSFADTESARARLRREVAMLQRVQGKYVAQILDAELSGENLFIVTELISGPTLEAEVQNGRYTEEDLFSLGKQLETALSTIHQAGVLHRDIKPSNVMLRDGEPVLIDFGISQANVDSRLTLTGFLTHTPGFCDPRILAGADPDKAADWWAMTAVLAYAATGVHPYGEGMPAAVMQRVLHEESNLPGLSQELEILFRAALANNLEQRLAYDDLLAGIADADVAADLAKKICATQVCATQNLLLATENLPLATENLPFATQNLPLATQASAQQNTASLNQDFASSFFVSSPAFPASQTEFSVSENEINPQDVPMMEEQVRKPLKNYYFTTLLLGFAWVIYGVHLPIIIGVLTIFIGTFLAVLGLMYEKKVSRQIRYGQIGSLDVGALFFYFPFALITGFFRSVFSGIFGIFGGCLVFFVSQRLFYRQGISDADLRVGDFSLVQKLMQELPENMSVVMVLSVAVSLLIFWIFPSSRAIRKGWKITVNEILRAKSVHVFWIFVLLVLSFFGIFWGHNSEVYWWPLV